MSEHGILGFSMSALTSRHGKVLVIRRPVGHGRGDGIEVAGAAKLLRTETLGHLADDLGDETLLRGFNKNALDAE